MTTSQLTKRQAWFAHIEQCAASQFSQKEFCKHHDLSFVQFQYYRKRYLELKHADKNSSPVFVEMSAASLPVMQTISMTLPNGVEIALPQPFCPASLQQLLEVLRTC